jgi:hypothetical protein
MSAFQYGRDGICAIFEHFEIDVRKEFEPVEEALNHALYTDVGEDQEEPQPSE